MPSEPTELVYNDKLYTLDIALDSQRMSHAFGSLAREYFGENVEVRNVGIEVIRRRNQRCVIRYIVEAVDPATQWRHDWRVIGKVYKANRGERVYEAMQELWEKGFSREAKDHVSIPEPLDFSSSLCMLFQEEVPGLPVKTWLKKSPEPIYLRQFARTLSKLHRCPLIPDKPFRMKDHLTRCHPTHQFLSLACPELAPKVDYIVDSAYKIEAGFDEKNFTAVHGDFHMGQVHLEDGKAWMIDFDALSYGDPASDLGNILVFLRGKSKTIPHVNQLIDAFLEEYFLEMDREIARRIPLYEGLTHLRRACKVLRLQDDGWQRRIKRMLDYGVACIEEMSRIDSPSDVSSLRLEYDEELEAELEEAN